MGAPRQVTLIWVHAFLSLQQQHGRGARLQALVESKDGFGLSSTGSLCFPCATENCFACDAQLQRDGPEVPAGCVTFGVI